MRKKQAMRKKKTLRLPQLLKDIWIVIFGFLDIDKQSLRSCMFACKKFNNYINNDINIIKRLFLCKHNEIHLPDHMNDKDLIVFIKSILLKERNIGRSFLRVDVKSLIKLPVEPERMKQMNMEMFSISMPGISAGNCIFNLGNLDVTLQQNNGHHFLVTDLKNYEELLKKMDEMIKHFNLTIKNRWRPAGRETEICIRLPKNLEESVIKEMRSPPHSLSRYCRVSVTFRFYISESHGCDIKMNLHSFEGLDWDLVDLINRSIK
jgi:hypothetical protein